MYNKVILMGRMVADAEMQTSKDGEILIATFTVAVDRQFSKETTDFIRCKAFNKSAEFIEKYFGKGKMIMLDGTWQTGQYTDKNDNLRYVNEMIVNNVMFTGESKKNNEDDEKPTPKKYSKR